MGYTKDKNLIKYQGKNYQIIYNFTDGTLTTNHPKGKDYIRQTANRSYDILAQVIFLAAKSNEKLNPFIETISSQAPRFLDKLVHAVYSDANKYIKIAKDNWNNTLELEKSGGWDNLSEWTTSMAVLKFHFNKLELKWFKRFKNAEFVKHFAGQLEMYENFLAKNNISEIIDWYNNNNIEISPYLKNKNLLQVIKELEINMHQNFDIGILNTYEKYKYLENTNTDGWTYQILKSREDFKKEADNMHNCLYRMEYDKIMSNGQCVIVIAIKPDGTKIDIELQPTGDGKLFLKQAYYKRDKWLTKEDRRHLAEWLDGMNNLRG